MKSSVFKIICLFSLLIAFPVYVKGEEDKEAFQKAVQELKRTLDDKYFILRDEKIEYLEEFPENREDILKEYQNEAEFYQTELNDITFKLFYEPKLMILPDGEKSRQAATMYHEMLKRYGENPGDPNVYKAYTDHYEQLNESEKRSLKRSYLVNAIVSQIYRGISAELPSSFYPILFYFGDLEILQEYLEGDLFDHNKAVLKWSFHWKRDEIVKWFMRKKPQIIADEKEDFFNSMLSENNLEGMKWIAQLVEIELKPEHLEKAIANRQWEIADWLIEKTSQFLSQTDFTKMLETMQRQKDQEGIQWISNLKESREIPEHLGETIKEFLCKNAISSSH